MTWPLHSWRRRTGNGAERRTVPRARSRNQHGVCTGRRSTRSMVRLLPCPLLDDRDDVLVAELVVGHRRAIATLVTFRQPRWIPFGLAVVVAMCLSAVKGLTDMEMGVDEARHNKPASGVDDLG